MPHCPNCGEQVKAEYHYCGRCGFPQADDLNDEPEQRPPSGTAATRQGFLSGRSLQYLSEIRDGDKEVDRDSVGYSNVSRDVGAGLADFAMVASIPDINLLSLILENSNDSEALGKDVEQLTQREVEERLMWMGLIRLPKLYDRSFGTAWSEEFSEQLTNLREKAEELSEDDPAQTR
jgi:hypothetical protein